MKKLVLAGCAVLISSAVAYGASTDGPYMGVKAGMAMPKDSDVTDSRFPAGLTADMSYSHGPVASLAAGYKSGPMRFEGELEYQKTGSDQVNVSANGFSVGLPLSGDVTATSLFLNFYYDFVNSSKFTPYLTAGVGRTWLKVDDFSITIPGVGTFNDSGSYSDNVFAYQVGAGIGYAVTDSITLDLSYRYFETQKADFDGTEAKLSSHNLLIGGRFGF